MDSGRATLTTYGTCTLDDDGCSTCGDTTIPVRVLETMGVTALCEDRTGQQATIATDFVPNARPGDVLLVHMGVAIACVQNE